MQRRLIPGALLLLTGAMSAAGPQQATAAAKSGDKGSSYQGAVSVAPGVWLYQLTEDGLALELTAKGTKYYKDSDLN